MPRCGRRPGAGAPKGNTNALKHGRHSKLQQRLLDLIAADPEAMAIMRQLMDHQDAAREQRRVEALALLTEVIERAQSRTLEQARHNPSPALSDRAYCLYEADNHLRHVFTFLQKAAAYTETVNAEFSKQNNSIKDQIWPEDINQTFGAKTCG